MDVEFDADKDAINRFKHRLPLAFGKRVLEAEDHVILPSIRPEDGEDRFKAVALVDGELHTAVHVWRGNVARLISVRRSNASERRNYDRYSSGPERPRGF
jgi:uncharacterized DUF497 family protein